MNLEMITLIYSMINNLIISVIKIIGASIFQLSSLIADGMQTLMDFITDILCLICSKLSKKKPTKYHPFGFGKIEYLANVFTGVILFIIGIYLIVSSFGKQIHIPSLKLLWLLLFVIILKLIAILIMHIVGKRINSEMLITSVEESKTDLYSTLIVAIITILLQFKDRIPILAYSDIIGTIIIGILVIKVSLKVLLSNSLSLIGEIDNNEEIIAKITKLLSQYNEIYDTKIELIKYGSYYKLELDLELDPNLTLTKITNLEKKIKRSIIAKKDLKIKYVTIYVFEK